MIRKLQFRLSIFCFILSFFCFSILSAQGDNQPLTVETGQVFEDVIISISSPVLINGVASKGVFCAGDTVIINGEVKGDVAVIGGKVVLGEKSSVSGNIILIGSASEKKKGSKLGGKIFSAGFFDNDITKIFNNPAGYLFSQEYTAGVISSRIFFSILWFVLAIIVIKLYPAHVAFAAKKFRSDPGVIFGVGIVGFLGFFVFLIISIALCIILVGFPLIFLLMIFSLAVWIFGMITIFSFVGSFVCRKIGIAKPSAVVIILVAILLWTLLKFVPVVSFFTHMTAFVASIGVSLGTKFGTGKRWLNRSSISAADLF